MKIGALQMDVIKNNKEKNLDTIERLVHKSQADIVVLPELFSTGYFFNSKKELEEAAEEIPSGYTTQRLSEIARKESCHFVGAIVEKASDRFHISALVIGPAGLIGCHRKRHLTKDEKLCFASGDSSQIYDIKGCRVGVLVCFEGWFPESSRELMMKGAQVICHSALTTQQRTLDIMRVRAIENKAFVIVANSITTESYSGGTITFRGDSRVIDYEGNILACANKEAALILTEVDVDEALKKDIEDCDDLIEEVKPHWV